MFSLFSFFFAFVEFCLFFVCFLFFIAFSCIFSPWGGPCGPWWVVWTSLEVLGELSGLSCGPLGHPYGCLGAPWGGVGSTCGCLWDPEVFLVGPWGVRGAAWGSLETPWGSLVALGVSLGDSVGVPVGSLGSPCRDLVPHMLRTPMFQRVLFFVALA